MKTNDNKIKNQLFFIIPSRPENDLEFICKDSYQNIIGICKHEVDENGKNIYKFYDRDKTVIAKADSIDKVRAELVWMDKKLMQKAYERRMKEKREQEVKALLDKSNTNNKEQNR